MNVNFKVLWFEDEMGWRPSSERSMKKIIESHNLVPIITWKKGDEGDAEEELKKEYDDLVREFKVFRNKFKSLIKDQMDTIDEIFCDVDESCEIPFRECSYMTVSYTHLTLPTNSRV